MQEGRWSQGTLWLLLLVVACGESEPGTDPFIGRWLLTHVNGAALPAAGEGSLLEDPLVGGRLIIPTQGFSQLAYCQEPGGLEIPDTRYLPGSATLAQLGYPQPLSFPLDTLRLSGDLLTLEHNRRSDPSTVPTDLLRFRRLAESEYERYGGTPCDFPP